MESKNIKYIPQLDHIRFFAALLVIFFHVAHNSLTQKLHFEVGVDLFFTLSGFIFFLIAENSNKDILYGKFIYNRFLRIYPLVIVLFFLAIVVMRKHFTVIDYLNLFGLNLTGDGSISWIAGDWGYKYLSFNWWTIGVEFIFYLIFPFLFKFYKENGIYFLIKTLALIILLRYGLYYIRVGEDGWKNLAIEFNYSVFGHIDTFIVGMISAFIYLKSDKFVIFKNIISSKINFVMLLALTQVFLIFSDSIDNLLYPTIIGSLCGLLILSYISSFKNVNGKITGTLSYLGSISFSLYLLHSFVKDAVDGLGIGSYIAGKINLIFNFTEIETSILMVIILYLPLIILLSALTFNTIEKPFLQMRVNYLRKREGHLNSLELLTNNQEIKKPSTENY
jgi:peptidoglycan/LPS O-acetylase OafA/YrhL